jgi:hypothetical protein
MRREAMDARRPGRELDEMELEQAAGGKGKGGGESQSGGEEEQAGPPLVVVHGDPTSYAMLSPM